jgi:broad specificity phosphatase PhoE
MMKYLILVKHSLPEIVKHLPAHEWHLSGDGRLRAERLADRLRPYQPELVISSTEPKAKETAEIVAAALKLEAQVVEDLHEHNRSQSPYLSKEQFEESVHRFFLNPHSLVFGNETADQAHRRFSKAAHSVLEKYKDRTIGIVSHGTVISLFVSNLIGISNYGLWKELGLPSFVVLDMSSKTLIAHENIS